MSNWFHVSNSVAQMSHEENPFSRLFPAGLKLGGAELEVTVGQPQSWLLVSLKAEEGHQWKEDSSGQMLFEKALSHNVPKTRIRFVEVVPVVSPQPKCQSNTESEKRKNLPASLSNPGSPT